MSSITKKTKLIIKLIKEQHRLSPVLLPLSIINAVLFEGKVLLVIYLPSFMLRLASGEYSEKSAIIIAIMLTTIIPVIAILQNIVEKKVNNENEKVFNLRIGTFDSKLFSLELATAESNTCLEFEEEALMGVYQTQGVIVEIFSVLLGRIITIITSSFIFIKVNIMLIAFVIIMLILQFIIDEKTSKLNRVHKTNVSKKSYILNYFSEIMFGTNYGAEERLYDMNKFLLSGFKNKTNEIVDLEKKHTLNNLKYDILSAAIVLIQTGGVYLFAVWQNQLGNIQIYDFLIYTSAMLVMSGAIRQIMNSYTVLSTMSSYYDATEEYMSKPECGSSDGHDSMPNSIKELEFENVSFTYPNQTVPAVKNLSFKLTSNDKTAIVGENGAGKSTIIKLLLRLYKVDEGRILLNGKSIYEYDWNDYCSFFSSAFQDYNVYSLSIGDNLLFGRSCDDTEKYLKNLGLLNKINEFPLKLETPYTKEFEPNGVLFSGGEEQKLIIARALCKKSAKVLTLDEPTASLDPLGERDLNRLICGFNKDRFVLFISHRFTTTKVCTKILVLNEGELVEIGSHRELMKADGLYAKMYNMQTEYYEKEQK